MKQPNRVEVAESFLLLPVCEQIIEGKKVGHAGELYDFTENKVLTHFTSCSWIFCIQVGYSPV